MRDLTIIIDTREQRGYTFEEKNVRRAALPAGDYSVEGYENLIAIERKSLDDWIGTLLHARGRFGRELTKLKSYAFAAVVIEATPEDILRGAYTSQMQPQSLLGLTAEFMVRQHPIVVVLAGARPHARLVTEKLLQFAVNRVDEIRRSPFMRDEYGVNGDAVLREAEEHSEIKSA